MDPIITSALTSFVTTMATNSSKVPMQTLDDLWYLAFGRINFLAEKKKAENEIALTEFKNSVAEKILSIKEENLQEPPLSVVGPAIDASRFYIEEEELREMFAKVIASSMDKSKSENVHHSFVEIIKQLSTEDAKNIQLFQYEDDLPIVQFKKLILNDNEQSYTLLKSNVFSGNYSDIISGDENTASVTNLARLGLVDISYENFFTDKKYYNLFMNSTYYRTQGQLLDPELNKIEIKEGIIRTTPFGKAFVGVCL